MNTKKATPLAALAALIATGSLMLAPANAQIVDSVTTYLQDPIANNPANISTR